MKKPNLLFIFSILFYFTNDLNAQNWIPRQNFSSGVGLKTRVTPIYVGNIIDRGSFGNIDILQQPDAHLSGPAFFLFESFGLGNQVRLTLQQSLRRDLIFQSLSFDAPPTPDYVPFIKKKWIYDFNADISKKITGTRLGVTFGVAVNSINSGYIETKRIRDSTAYKYERTKRNFIFFAWTTSITWQRKYLFGELRFGYVNNPTLFHNKFLYPELSLQYELLHLFR